MKTTRPTVYWTAPLLLAVLWTLGVWASWRAAAADERAESEELAKLEARASFEKDLLFRRWATMHGGVYVPATEQTPPNPYLAHVPERDVVTPSGRRLTLLNPAYVIRQVHELGAAAAGVRSHITSLNPLRPENAADQWETAALRELANGAPEIASLAEVGGALHLRLMRPLRTEARCLGCHAAQGYKEGDLRGGISVAVPMKPYVALVEATLDRLRLAHALAWLAGMGILALVSAQMHRTGRRRDEARNAILEEHERIKAIFDGTPEILVQKDRDLVYQKVNPAFCRLLGKAEAEIVGKTDYDLYPREEAEAYRLADRRVIESARPETLEELSTGSQGPRWLEVTKTPLQNLAGETVGILCSARDIHELKALERSRRESEQRYRSLFENAGDAIFIMRGDRFIDCNRQTLEMYGVAREQIIGQTPYRYSPPRQPDGAPSEAAAKEKVAAALAGEPQTFEWRHCRANGEVFEAEVSLARLVLSGEVLIQAFVRDISARKRAEAALRASEAMLKQAQRVASLGHYVFDAPAGTWTCSEALENVFGIDAAYEKTTAGWLELVHPDDREAMGVYLQEHVVGAGNRFNREYRIVRKNDGAVRWAHGLGDLTYAPDGSVATMFGTIQDITDHKAADERAITLQEQLQQAQKMESIGRLAGGVAHDFNNLLTGISGNISLALLELSADDPLREPLLEANRAAESAAGLTRQLLAFSRKQLVEPKIVDLNEMVARSQKMLRRLISEDIELEFLPGDDLGCVRVDPAQLEQILINLAANARDAMPNGGRLTVETSGASLDEEAARGCGAPAPGDYVALTVSDSGVGMTEEVVAHIFEPFFTTKEKGKGVGLGMATVYGAVQQNGGGIQVRSSPGRGTTVRVLLPSVDAAAAPAPSAGPQESPRGVETIILVEDEDLVRTLAEKALRRLGYRVLSHPNGDSALAAIRELREPLHLLMTDVVMPGMDGRALAEQARALRPEIKVLFSSGYSEDVIAHHGVLDEGLKFIGKPYTLEMLAKRVREALDAG